ncbi:MAG: TlpA family protein disulfide reductase [Acidimicrobiia bacterium]
MPKSARPPKPRYSPTASGGTKSSWTFPVILGAAIVGVLAVILIISVAAPSVFGGKKSSPKNRVEVADVVDVSGTPLPADTGKTPDPAVGMAAPTLRGVDTRGQSVTAPGTGPTVMAFLAHWCPHCQREVPRITRLRQAGSWPSNVALVGVSTSVAQERGNYPPSAWFDSARWDAPVLVDTKEGTAARVYGQQAFPYLVWIDGSGNVVLRTAGEIEESQLARMLQQLSAGQAPSAPPQ